MPLPQEKRYSYADLLDWDEQERMELIYGEIRMMSPPSRAHQSIIMELSRQLATYLLGKTCKVYPAPFGVRLFEKNGDRPYDVDTLVEPDISVICDPGKLDDAGCKGAPDLILEVLSPSTQRHDRLTKFNLYQQAGVRECCQEQDILTAAAALVLTLEDGHYHSPAAYSAGASVPVGVLEDCRIDLSTVFSM